MGFIGNKKLKEILDGTGVIEPFKGNNIKNAAYELSLGNEVFQTDAKPRAVKKLNDGEKIYISPGQFALLLTEEKVKIPEDKIAFISIKAGIKFKGLVNVSGFHVDPGFEGKLMFSVYNAGPSVIVLSRGEKYFPMWFADISETDDYNGKHDKQNSIPDAPVEALSQNELASPNVLSDRIEELKFLKTRIEWIVLVIIAFLSTLLVKAWTDSSKLKDAVEFGYNKKIERIASDSTHFELQNSIDILENKVDSLVKVIEVTKASEKKSSDGKE